VILNVDNEGASGPWGTGFLLAQTGAPNAAAWGTVGARGPHQLLQADQGSLGLGRQTVLSLFESSSSSTVCATGSDTSDAVDEPRTKPWRSWTTSFGHS
jgi:hypothetical protein